MPCTHERSRVVSDSGDYAVICVNRSTVAKASSVVCDEICFSKKENDEPGLTKRPT